MIVYNPAFSKAPLGSGGRFRSCVRKMARRSDVRNPKALCASIGRAKYGGAKMAEMAARGRRRHRRNGMGFLVPAAYLVPIAAAALASGWGAMSEARRREQEELQAAAGPLATLPAPPLATPAAPTTFEELTTPGAFTPGEMRERTASRQIDLWTGYRAGLKANLGPAVGEVKIPAWAWAAAAVAGVLLLKQVLK